MLGLLLIMMYWGSDALCLFEVVPIVVAEVSAPGQVVEEVRPKHIRLLLLNNLHL